MQITNLDATGRAAIAKGYCDEAEKLDARGISVFDPAEVDQLVTTPMGQHLVTRLLDLAWGFKGDDRNVAAAANKVATYATQVAEQVEAGQRIMGSISGETWVSTAAHELQEAVARRQQRVDEAVQITYLARLQLEG